MSEKEIEIPKFKHWNKNIQIVFVGLLIGAALFGIYAVVLGIMNMTESPIVVSDIAISNDYPLAIQHNYYKSSMRNEIVIYNVREWGSKSVWIGTTYEWDAFKNMKLITDTQHSFNGPFVTAKSFMYKAPLTNKSDEYIIIVDGVKKYYLLSVSGDIDNLKVDVGEVRNESV